MNRSPTSSPPVVMVNLIITKPKSAASAKTTVISSQSVSSAKKLPFLPPLPQKSVKQLKNKAVNKKNTKLEKVIKKYKQVIPKSKKKFQTNQRSSQPPIVPSVNIKPNLVKPSQQLAQLKPQLTTSVQVNEFNQSVTKTNANGKTALAAINNHHSAGKSQAILSTTKLHNQPLKLQPILASRRKSLPLTKSQTIAPMFLGGKPSYPWLSRRNNEEGKVLLRIQVNAQGKATVIQIKHSSGSARLDNAAVNHVQNNDFIPAQHNGKPIIAWKELRFVFKLN